ncbi:Hypothetical predicted protein, partial [Pelobates cultripes]
MAKDSQRALQWSKQLFYEKSNKADTLLTRKLRPKTYNKRISKINSPRIFSQYFTTLYNHNPDPSQTLKQDIEIYLRNNTPIANKHGNRN